MAVPNIVPARIFRSGPGATWFFFRAVPGSPTPDSRVLAAGRIAKRSGPLLTSILQKKTNEHVDGVCCAPEGGLRALLHGEGRGYRVGICPSIDFLVSYIQCQNQPAGTATSMVGR